MSKWKKVKRWKIDYWSSTRGDTGARNASSSWQFASEPPPLQLEQKKNQI